MKVKSAWYEDGNLILQIDGHRVALGEKYTILELGFAVLLGVDDSSRDWLAEVSETIPASGDGMRGCLAGSDGMAVTSDPIVVALSLADWRSRNDGPALGNPVVIPNREEAIRLVRARPILNDFNQPYAGLLPKEWMASSPAHV